MKKLYVLLLVLFTSFAGFAQSSIPQRRSIFCPALPSFVQKSSHPRIVARDGASATNTYARTTGTGDTVTMSNTVGDNIVLYNAGADSGYARGTNYWGDKAFAERYDFSGADSTLKIVGVVAKFGGKVSASSTKSITFNVWGVGAQQYITAGTFYSGFPSSSVLSRNVPLTQLTPGTQQQFMFDGQALLTGSFFIGYNINYSFSDLNGDTVGLYTSEDGDRNSPASYLQVTINDVDTTVDTIINVQNATQWSDGAWHDDYTGNDSLFNDLAIYPIVTVWHPTAVKGITRKELTFYGSYPNPANDQTNIKLSLATQADVTVQLTDMAGRVVNTITQQNVAAGEHTIPLSTVSLPSGEYIGLITTSKGDGIASKIIVRK